MGAVGLRDLDLDRWERAFAVRRRARIDGQAERPPSDSIGEPGVEREIRTAIDAAIAERATPAIAALDAARQTLARCAPAAIGLSITGAAQLALRLEESKLAGPVAAAVAHAQRTRQALAAFQDAHGLTHNPPRFPASVAMAVGLLFVAAMLEAVFSATLFVRDTEGGYVGAASIALGLGGANVLLGVLAGYVGLRYWRARHPALKAMGLGAFIVFAGLAVALNLFAAHYRESLARAHDTQGPLALLTRGQLFGLVSPEAVVLLMLGVGVWIFSAAKGYSGLDEPYLDYGRLDRLRAKADADLADLQDDAVETLTEPIAQANSAIEADLSAQRARLDAVRAAYDEAGAAVLTWRAARRRLLALRAALMAIYREENTAARATPAPPGFAATAMDADGVDSLDAQLHEIAEAVMKAEADYNAAVQAATETRAQLNAIHQDSRTRLFGAAA